jgi:cytochrome c-type biogenesis protein CcmF
MSVPVALMLIFLAGVGPALPWRKGSLELLRGKFRWPTVLALVTGIVLAVAGVRAPLAWLAFVLAVFSMGLLAVEFTGPTSARHRATGESWLVALWRVCTSNRRRYGGYIVHGGVLILAVGVASSSTFRREQEWTIEVGAAEQFGRYQIHLDSVWAVHESNRDGVIAATTVTVGGRVLTRLNPRLNYYKSAMEPIGTPAVRENLREDLYLVLMAYTADGKRATIKAIASPLVAWIWLGGGIVGLGALFALWPGARSGGPRRDTTAEVGRPRVRPVSEARV